MGTRLRSGIAVLLGVCFCSVAFAADNGAKAVKGSKQAKQPRVGAERAKVIVSAYKALILTKPADKTCKDADSACRIDITAYPTTGKDGEPLCYLQLPEKITFDKKAASGTKDKAITWKLDPNNLEVEFHDKYGILLVNPGPNSQTEVKSPRTDQYTFEAIHHREKANKAAYIPIVTFKAGPNATEGVCATSDPQIVND